MSLPSLLIYLLIFGTVVCYKDSCKKTDKLPKRCDYIVVGAGAAGAVVASRLSENPNVNVCLFEAGFRDTEGPFANAVTVPRFISTLFPGDITWNTTTTPQFGLNNRTLFNGMGKTLGGSTSHNALLYFRGNKVDYDFWAATGAPGWSYEEVLPFFLKSENNTIEELRNSPLHSTCGPLTVSHDAFQFDTPLGQLWKNAAKELGIPSGECNRERPIGICGVQSNIKNGKRDSTATAFLHPVEGRRNLFIVTEALVGKILITDRDKRAYGIRYRQFGRIKTIRADIEIIVSGGTYESAKLLQLSGIGPKSLLQRFKIRPHKILPVGQSFQDHTVFLFDIDSTTDVATRANLTNSTTVGQYLFQGKGLLATVGNIYSLFFDLERQKFNWPEIQLTVYDVAFETLFSNQDKLAGILTGPQDDGMALSGSTLFYEQLHPRIRGTVNIRSTDPEDLPVIDPRYFQDPRDLQTFVKGIRIFQGILRDSPSMRQAGAKIRLRNQESVDMCSATTLPDSDEFWICIARSQINNDVHPVSSCPIGLKTDKWAVVDPELRVHGIKDLRVADASVMPEITSSDTAAPTIMIGERGADFVMRDYDKYRSNRRNRY